MGLFQAKTRVIQAAAAALALFALPAAASTMNRAPASQPVNQQIDSEGPTEDMRFYGQGAAADCRINQGKCANSADSFATAAEQASFLGAYQMWYGPYGTQTDPAEREKQLRETAKAIEDCIQGRDCGEEKQKKVLKALTQYNFGQDIKRMMLTNNTNREKMASIDTSGDAVAGEHKPGVLNQNEINAALGKGMQYELDQADPIKPYQKKTIGGASLHRSYGSDREPVFQMKEDGIRGRHIDPKYLAEREILGEQFLNDYGAFLDGYEALRAPQEQQYYKYVAAKDGTTRIYESTPTVDNEKFAEIQKSQNDPRIRKIYENYRRNLKPLTGKRRDDGKVYVDADNMGSTPEDLGFGSSISINPAQVTDVDLKDLVQNGEIPDANQGRALVRIVNQRFRETAAENEKKKAAEAKQNRSLASRNSESAEGKPPTITTITLAPQDFDKFLDEIWPSAATRQLRAAQAVAEEQTAEEPEIREAPRDKYGRPLFPDARPNQMVVPRE